MKRTASKAEEGNLQKDKPAILQGMLQEAISLHHRGEVRNALAIYEQILEVLPDNFDCLHLSGVAKFQLGEYAAADHSISLAISRKPNFAAAYSNRGLARKELGKFQEALADFNQALSLDNDYTDARFNRANVFIDMKSYESALQDLDVVLRVNPKYADAYNSAGIALKGVGRHREAMSRFEQAINLNPANEKYYNSRGSCFLELGQQDEALEDFTKAISLQPHYVEALVNKGNVLREFGRLSEAGENFKTALGIRPDFAIGHLSVGLLYSEQKDQVGALSCCEAALAIDPSYAEAHFCMGNILVSLERIDDSIAAYSKALVLKPNYAEAFNNRGIALARLLRSAEALTDYERAINIRPNYPEAHVNRGNILKGLGNYEQAIESYNRAIQLNPASAEAHFNRGLTFGDLKKFEEAIVDYDRALDLKPGYEYLLGLRMHTEMKICKWERFDQGVDVIRRGVANDNKVIVPFFLLGLIDDPALQQKASYLFGRNDVKRINKIADLPDCRGRKIRLAYFSADYYNHATSYLIADMLESHDREKFELFGVSLGAAKDDPMRQRVSKAFDHFIDARNYTDIEIATLSRDIGIDIAVDLGGYTLNARTGAFAHGCAPVQVNYLGFPGTMGVDYIDYIIADRTVIPSENEQYFSERVLYLPHCYQANDRKRLQSERPVSRMQVGLPEEGIVFCCFNNNWKILPAVFEQWMRLLREVHGSVLWLLADTPAASRNLRIEAQKRGIDPDRLVFAPRVTTDEHLSRHRLADIFLDTLPYNAHTTASDALWSGVPIVTRVGKSFASRVSSSLLRQVELSELITQSEEEYEQKALYLAQNPEVLKSCKEKLMRNRLTSPLFDTNRFTRDMETLLCSLVRVQ